MEFDAILWALDTLVETRTITEQICSLKVQFTNFIRVGSQLDLKVLGRDGKSIQAELSVGRLRAATLIVTFGARQRIKEIEVPDLAPKMSPGAQPVHFDRLEEVANLCGSVSIKGATDEIQQYFPNAAAVLGSRV